MINIFTTILLFILFCIWVAGFITDIKGHEITGYIWWHLLSLIVLAFINYFLMLANRFIGGVFMLIIATYSYIAPVVIWILLIKEWIH